MQVIHTSQPGRPNESITLTGRILHDFKTTVAHVQLIYTREFGDVLLMNNEIQSSSSDQEFYHAKLVGGAVRGSESNVVIFGGGEGCTARHVLDVAPYSTVTQYDYDIQTMLWSSIALLHWNRGVYNDPRLKVVIADADEVILEACSIDAVIIDLFDYAPETEAFMTRVICKSAAALRPGGRLSAYLGDDTQELRMFVGRLQSQLGYCFKVSISLGHIPSYGGMNSVFLKIEKCVG